MTSTANPNYWALLGLSPGSSPAELKSAFRREARRWHPDLNKNNRNAEERFKWVNAAYAVLNDPRRKLQWEVAGRPTIEIKEVIETKESIRSEKEVKPHSNDYRNNISLNSAEKLLTVLISFIILIGLNAFIL